MTDFRKLSIRELEVMQGRIGKVLDRKKRAVARAKARLKELMTGRAIKKLTGRLSQQLAEHARARIARDKRGKMRAAGLNPLNAKHRRAWQLANAKPGEVRAHNGLVLGYGKTKKSKKGSWRSVNPNGVFVNGSRYGSYKKAVRYADKEGHQWSGMGPKPAWLKAHIKQGATIDSFLVH